MSNLPTVLSSAFYELICVSIPPVREGALVCPVLRMRELSRKKNSAAHSCTAVIRTAQSSDPNVGGLVPEPHQRSPPPTPSTPLLPLLINSLFLWQGPWETTSCLKRGFLSPTRPQTHFPCVLLGLLSGFINNTPLFGTPIQNQLRTT